MICIALPVLRANSALSYVIASKVGRMLLVIAVTVGILGRSELRLFAEFGEYWRFINIREIWWNKASADVVRSLG